MKKIVETLSTMVIIGLIGGFVLTLKQFMVSFQTIMVNRILQRRMFGLITLNLLESLKQWMTLCIIILLALIAMWLFFLVIRKSFLQKIVKMHIQEKTRARVFVAGIFCPVFLFFAAWGVNRYWLPHRLHPLSLLGDVGVLLFTILLGWNIIRPLRKGTLFVGSIVFIMFNSLLMCAGSANVSSIKISPAQALRSLPYATWTSIDKGSEEETRVTKYNPRRSFKGVNVYSSENMPGGYLLDMHGNVLHVFLDKREDVSNWRLIEPYKHGRFLVLIEPRALFMLDWDSNVIWEKKMSFHHDIAVSENGDIYALINRKTYSPRFTLCEPIWDNCLVILSEDGKIKKEMSFAKAVSKSKALFHAAKNQQKGAEHYHPYGRATFDIFHTNTIEIIDRDVFSGTDRLFKKGDVLFCIRNMNLIGVLDAEKEEIVWSLSIHDLEYPHHPSLLKNGNILVFDNGFERGYSRVLELNPVTEEIEWKYEGNPPTSFVSLTRGSSQRLPNGNTLITESDKGRVFEVTHDGEIVWEFYNPEIDEDEMRRATIYRMMRFTNPEIYP